MAWSNEQLQRGCRLGGIVKGKDGAVATNSSCATVAFVAGTHQAPRACFGGTMLFPRGDATCSEHLP